MFNLLVAPLVVLLAPLSSATTLFLNTDSPPIGPGGALARHLGLDALQSLPDFQHNEPLFLARSPDNSLFIAVEDSEIEAILPPGRLHSFDLAISKSAVSSAVPAILDLAQHSYSSVYDGSEDINSVSTFFATAETPSFAALNLRHLSELRRRYGATSPKYTEAASDIRALIEQAQTEPDSFHLAILAYSSSDLHNKRQPQSPLPPPHEPLGSISTCFASADVCNNSTDSCSGRGQCVEATKSGRSCYVCACGVTKTGKGDKVKTEYWTGQSCERKDISGPFTLLTGTVIVLLILVFGSISLLSSVGGTELPSTLLATAVHAKKD